MKQVVARNRNEAGLGDAAAKIATQGEGLSTYVGSQFEGICRQWLINQARAGNLSYEVLRARDVPEIAKHLHADENELIHHFVRLRTGDERPVAIGYTYIRGSVIPAVDIESLDGSFYAYVRSLGIEIHPAEQVRICAVLPSDEQLELLEAKEIALLRSSHVNCAVKDGSTAPFEYTETYYNSDMFSFTAQDPQATATPQW